LSLWLAAAFQAGIVLAHEVPALVLPAPGK
jgi:hypothetical protein